MEYVHVQMTEDGYKLNTLSFHSDGSITVRGPLTQDDLPLHKALQVAARTSMRVVVTSSAYLEFIIEEAERRSAQEALDAHMDETFAAYLAQCEREERWWDNMSDQQWELEQEREAWENKNPR